MLVLKICRDGMLPVPQPKNFGEGYSHVPTPRLLRLCCRFKVVYIILVLAAFTLSEYNLHYFVNDCYAT